MSNKCLKAIFAKNLVTLKKIALIVLIIAFAARPVYYIGCISYYELNIDYIINTYCVNTDKPELKCNGKCHLKTQLNLASTTTGSSDAILLISESFYPVYFQEKADFFLIDFIQYSHSKIDIAYSNLYHFNFISKALKPPIS